MDKIRYLCKDCLVAPTCTRLCGKFTDKSVDVLFDPPTLEELAIFYNELKKHKRCILCRKNDIIINIITYVNDLDDKTITATCTFCDTMYSIKQIKDVDYLEDIYWEFNETRLSSVFTFDKLFKDLGIKT